MAGDMSIIKYLEAALQAEGTRQSIIANNIANMNTPGYRRFDVKFDELLAAALDSGDDDPSKIELEIFQPRNTPVKTNGNDVSLDTEVGEMVKNSLRHQTFIRLIRKKYELMQRAIGLR